MKFLCTTIISVFLFALTSPVQARSVSRQRLPAELVRLSSKAKSARTWPELRRYAANLKSGKDRSLAYLVLGYREYQAELYDVAQEDLAKASSGDSPLSDLAIYYCASAAYKGGHPDQVADILSNFNKRYPSSTEHYAAIELLAQAYLHVGQPQNALHILQSEPRARELPALSLVLAHAYVDNGELQQAAQTFQDIYYAFPTAPQAKAAGESLENLKSQHGVNFPPVSDEIATARVEKLYATSHYAEALAGFEQLLKDWQNSSWAWSWNLGRAKCLIRLGKGSDAIETLVNSVAPTPELDAQLLATLVDAYAQIEDDTGVAKTLNKFQSEHFTSHWHAVALLRAANYFMYKGEWDVAPLYYRTLQEAFPKTPQGSEASWRLSWITYLTGKPDDARALLLSHIRNYPASPHVPAALYFLGRLEEESDPAKARSLYSLLERRYQHAYYAFEAANRLSALRKRSRTEASTTSASDFSVSELATKIPSVDPPGLGACPPSTDGENLAAFTTLEAMHLDDLAEHVVTALLARHPDSPELVLALSRLEDGQGRTDRAIHTVRKIAPDYYSQEFTDLPREIWQLLFPKPYIRVIQRYAAINHLDPYLVMGLIRQESGFNTHATSYSNARGLMQIVPSTVTHSRRYRNTVAKRLYIPAYNVRFGCAYLRELLKRYHGNAAQAVAAYNAGPTRVDRWLNQRTFRNAQEFVESVPFPETRIYLKAVLADSGVYRRLVKGPVEFAECAKEPSRSSSARVHKNLQSQSHPLIARRGNSRIH